MQVSNSRQTERTPKSQKHCKQWGGVTRSTEVWRPSPSTIYLLGTMAGSPRRLATADHVAMDPETGMPHTPAVRATEGGSSRPMQLMAREWVQGRLVLSLLVAPVVTWIVIVIVNIAVSGLFNAPINLSK